VLVPCLYMILEDLKSYAGSRSTVVDNA
jgi:hypothetical protein